MQLVELAHAEMEAVVGGKKNLVLVNINVDLSRCIQLGNLIIVRNNLNTTTTVPTPQP